MKTLRGSISKLRRPKLPLRHPLLGHAWLRQTERYRRQLLRLFRCAKSAVTAEQSECARASFAAPRFACRQKAHNLSPRGKVFRVELMRLREPTVLDALCTFCTKSGAKCGRGQEGSARGERPSQLRVPSPRRFPYFQI